LESVLNNAEIVSQEDLDSDRVNVGCFVRVFDISFEEELEYRIVGTVEADSLNGRISNDSPLGKALIGAAVGDVVDVDAPAGIFQYKVLEVRNEG